LDDKMMRKTDDVRVAEIKELISPNELLTKHPMTETAAETVYTARQELHRILHGEDDRMIVVIGPCSIHDPKAALEYGTRLKALRDEVSDDLLVIMRVYFEKPRTTVGWKGLINDPDMTDAFDINKGLHLARQLLLDLSEMGLPAGTEYLDLITPQYIADLVSWGAIGARTTESQGHRELSSGLSCAVGFKNATDGDIQVAVDALGAACRPHHFLSVTKEGHSAIVSTKGNEDCHIILRGGRQPNYGAASVDDAAALLDKAGLPSRLMIDTNHANSRKKPERQLYIARDICQQVRGGDRRIIGVMTESHLVGGRQEVVPGQVSTYGQSITDACLGWDDSVLLVRELAAAVAERRDINQG
jgi:3-deoxy-7-phosphoheptulonate synthase